MDNTIQLYSISELLGKNFFIPSYQRGYRWTKRHIQELLNDVYSFALKPNKSPKEFYCLQPIVLKRCTEKTIQKHELFSEFNNNEWYEIIDGQQRLTTIRILLSYLVHELYSGKTLFEKHRKHPFRLEYETRKGCTQFIDENRYSDDTIDFYFISEARKSIHDWFETSENIKDPQKAKEKIRNTFIYSMEDQEPEGVVQIIWYEIKTEENGVEENNENNSIETFIRINLGKIPLTSSELIKALFVQEREFYKDNDNENEIAKQKQLQIATDWDRIENTLQDEDFWWFLNEKENDASSRIDYLFKIIKDVEIINNPELIKKIGTDEDSSFRFYYLKFNNHTDFDSLKIEWDRVQHYFLTLQEWYNNPIWYHYIGFLISTGVSILDILKLTKNDYKTGNLITTKTEITASIKKKIKEHFKKVVCDFNVVENNYFINLSYTSSEVKFIREFLLIYNLEYIVKQCEAHTIIYKFPFKTFKEIKNLNGVKMSWDVEHVDSFTTNKLPNRPSKVLWLNYTKEEIEDTANNKDLLSKIEEFITNEKTKIDFEELQNEIIKLFEDDKFEDEIKNNIGNLTLLDAGTNRGYGNAIFPTKRKKIIEKDELGIFIPICTKNVFLKYFNKDGKAMVKWNYDDFINYSNNMAKTLEYFLNIKPVNTTDNE
jgi:uncharacterized protein with ParB-like and HNH nuclease domain